MYEGRYVAFGSDAELWRYMKKSAIAFFCILILIVNSVAVPVLAARQPSDTLSDYRDIFKDALNEAMQEVGPEEDYSGMTDEEIQQAQEKEEQEDNKAREEAQESVENIQDDLAKEQTNTGPVGIIIDADMSTDVDDVAAVRIAQELEYQGLCDIIGFAYCSKNPSGNNIKAAEGLFDYAGLTDVPVAKAAVSYEYGGNGDYWGVLWQYKTTDHPVYDNAVNMYKEVLSSHNGKIRIVTTGFLTNIKELLKDPEGYELVKNKVDAIYVAGGEYDGLCYNLSYDDTRIAATDYVARNCPVPLYFTMDVLGAIRCGGHLTKIDTYDSDILSKAYAQFGLEDGQNYGNCDGTAVYCAITQDTGYGGYFEAIPCNFTISYNNGGVLTQTKSDTITGIYMLEATYTKNKYELYSSSTYTNLFDSYLEADYLRRHQ